MNRPDRAVAVAAAAVAVDGFANAPLLGAIAADQDVSLAAATDVAVAYALLYGVAQPLWGLLSERVGRVRALRAGLLTGALGAAASAAAPNLGVLLVARGVSAVGLAAVIATSLAQLGDTLDGGARARAVGRLLSGYAVGTATGAVGAGLAAQAGAWPVAYAVSAVGCLIAVAGLRGLPGDPAAGRRGRPGAGTDVVSVLRDRRSRALVVLGGVEGASLVAALTLLAPALADRGRPALLGGVALAAYAVAVTATARFVPTLRGRIGGAGLIRLGAGVAGGGLLVAAAAPDVAGVLVAALALGVAWATLHATLLVRVTETAPRARGAAVALFTAAVFTGSAVSTRLAAGPLDDGRAGAVFLAAGLGVLGLGLVAASRLHRLPACADPGKPPG